MLMQIVSSIANIYQWGFPKVVVLKRSTKGAMSSPFYFRRVAYSYLLSEKLQRKFH